VYRAFSFAEYEGLLAEASVFRSVSAQSFGLVGLRDGDTTRRVFANIVTADFFETFGVRPVIGRTFTTEEARPGADVPVAILSHAAWTRMGGGERVLQQTITLNRRVFTIVGVAPRGFGGSLAVATPEVWVPTGMFETMSFDAVSEGRRLQLSDPQVRELALVARLHDGATPSSIATGLDLVSRRRAAANPADDRDQALEVVPLSRIGVSTSPQSDAPLSGLAMFLLAFSGVVLLIASFNLANMLLARGRSRRREFAIRLAIGGSRPRLVRQLLVENLLVALIGGAAGLMLSWWAIRLLLQALPPNMPVALMIDPAPDGRVFAATLGFIVLGAIISGLGPALHLARANVVEDLKSGNERAARRVSRWRGLTMRDLLVTSQLALTLVMLTAAGLFVRGALEAARSDPGFTLDRGIIVNVDTSLGGYDIARSRDLQRDVLTRLGAMPGVTHASVASILPFAEFGSSRGIQKAGAPVRGGTPGSDALLVEATTNNIGAGYFEAMGIPLRRGRDFTESEAVATEGERLAIVDEMLATKLFGHLDVVGEQVQYGMDADGSHADVFRIVGVAAGIRHNFFDIGPQPAFYTPLGRDFHTNVYFHAVTALPTADAEAAMLPSIRQALRDIDPGLPVVVLETRPMFRTRNMLVWVTQAGARVVTVLAMAALVVALVGVYGVKAYLVARRTREIGIRMALGAKPGQVMRLVFREGLIVAGVGLALGLALSVLAGRLVRGFLFQGRAFDLSVIVVATLALLATSALATWIPARRALRIQPTTALRTE
jgi:predicted permease